MPISSISLAPFVRHRPAHRAPASRRVLLSASRCSAAFPGLPLSPRRRLAHHGSPSYPAYFFSSVACISMASMRCAARSSYSIIVLLQRRASSLPACSCLLLYMLLYWTCPPLLSVSSCRALFLVFLPSAFARTAAKTSLIMYPPARCTPALHQRLFLLAPPVPATAACCPAPPAGLATFVLCFSLCTTSAAASCKYIKTYISPGQQRSVPRRQQVFFLLFYLGVPRSFYLCCHHELANSSFLLTRPRRQQGP